LGILSLSNAAYVLRQGAKAAKVLALVYQKFCFREESIGINEEGNCKFWINSDYF
jgi:hypothetical protein